MTTLPQTTPLRLPTAAPVLVPAASFPMGPAPSQGGPQLTFTDVMRVIRANLWLIVLLVGLSAVAGYFVNRELAKRWPKFTSTGYVEIESRVLIDPLTGKYDEISDMRLSIEQRKHENLLRTDSLLATAMKNPEGRIRQTEWFRQFKLNDGKPDIKAAKEDLKEHLSVSAIPDSGLLRVGFEYKKPEDCQVIVEELVKIHLDQQRAIAENQFNAQTRQLQDMKRTFDLAVTDITRRTTDAQTRLANQGIPTGRSNFSLLEIEAQNIHKDLLELSKEMRDAKRNYERVKMSVDKGETLFEVERAIDMDSVLAGYMRELNAWELQRDMFLIGALSESPTVQRATKTIEIIKGKADARREELRVKYREELITKSRMMAESLAQDVKDQSAALETTRKTISELRGEEARLLRELEREKELRDMQMQIESKIRDLASVTDPASRAAVKWAPNGMPSVPEIPSFPKLSTTMPVAIMLGLFLALGIAFLRELMDDTVRTPRDITRVGNLNLLGIIADESDDPQVADTRLPIFDAPQSLIAEQFRQVRTRIAHASPLDTTRTIMVTGPSPLDGKTTVSANLAAGLALNGRKILLVDTNFRRPELHRIFGTTNDRGFADVLNGTATFDDVIATSRIPNLFVMPSGPKPMNATELFESQLLIDFIDRALEEYDHVIFDTGPFLIVSEAQALAPRVDGVVTVVRAHSESRGLLHRMRDSLRQVKAEHIGVILNAVRAQGGGYYRRSIKQFYSYQNEA